MRMTVSEINHLYVRPAREYWMKKQWDEALNKLDQGLVATNFDGFVTLTRGYVLLKKQMWSEAERMFSIALKKLPMPEYKDKARRALRFAQNQSDGELQDEIEKDMKYVWYIFTQEKDQLQQEREQRGLRVGLVTCTRHKASKASRARDLYGVNKEFVVNVEFAEQHYEKTYVVSARHGLVDLEQWLEPYDRALVDFDQDERCGWATFITANLKADGITESHTVYIHADGLYREYLEMALRAAGIGCRGIDYREVPTIEWLMEQKEEQHVILDNA